MTAQVFCNLKTPDVIMLRDAAAREDLVQSANALPAAVVKLAKYAPKDAAAGHRRGEWQDTWVFHGRYEVGLGSGAFLAQGTHAVLTFLLGDDGEPIRKPPWDYVRVPEADLCR